MRADRLLSIMLLLQVHRRLTARNLARRLEVSERTIYRDVDALSGAGVPITAERGNGGGLSLLDGFRTTLTGLTEREAQSLLLGQPARILTDLGLKDASGSALAKLLAAIPVSVGSATRDIRERIHIDEAGWSRSQERVEVLPMVQEALWGERVLDIEYSRESGATWRQVAPLGLVAKGNIWYLVARAEGEMRSYRVSRILKARPTEERFTRPEGFDLTEYWKRSSADFLAGVPQYDARLRAHRDIIPYLPHVGRFTRIQRIDPPDEAGWAPVSIRFQLEWEACHYVLGFGRRIEVVEPEGLARLVAEEARGRVDCDDASGNGDEW